MSKQFIPDSAEDEGNEFAALYEKFIVSIPKAQLAHEGTPDMYAFVKWLSTGKDRSHTNQGKLTGKQKALIRFWGESKIKSFKKGYQPWCAANGITDEYLTDKKFLNAIKNLKKRRHII
jgi:hypothetical protein